MFWVYIIDYIFYIIFYIYNDTFAVILFRYHLMNMIIKYLYSMTFKIMLLYISINNVDMCMIMHIYVL